MSTNLSLLGMRPTTLSMLAGALAPAPVTQPPWIAVRQRFQQFHNNLLLTPVQFLDGVTKMHGVVSCLNRRYYNSTSDTDNSFLIGSWAKGTAVRPPRDIDLHFVMPYQDYARFEGYQGNRQSALLQEVKGVLARTYPNTDMSGDGQVVLVNFESYNVEVVPAVLLQNGRYWICNTHDGGSYKVADPWAEVRYIDTVHQANSGNLRPFIQMLKAWQSNCSVPIKSFQLELLAADFLGQSPWRLHDFFWFDWITRDFFAYLYHRAKSFLSVPGTGELIYLDDSWQSRAESAYRRAYRACACEYENRIEAAGEEWQKIFGSQIPRRCDG